MPLILRRMAAAALMVGAMLAIGILPAAATARNTHGSAHATSRIKQDALCKQADRLRKLVIKKDGKRAPGRNICQDGTKQGKRPTHVAELRYKQTLYRLAFPPPPVIAVAPSQPAYAAAPATNTTSTSTASSSYTGGGVWNALAQCESSGNWSDNTGNGFYGGLQFKQSSWEAVGGTGSPADASPAEQIAKAQALQAQQGWIAWPWCARKLGLLH